MSKLRALAAPLVLGAMLYPAAVSAGPPAAIATRDGSERASQSFRAFAEGWMKQLNRGEARTTTELGVASKNAPVRFRLYGDDYQVELRATGSTRAPWVGILRYSEAVYRCTDADASRCRLADRRPVSEVFRFQNGKWVY